MNISQNSRRLLSGKVSYFEGIREEFPIFVHRARCHRLGNRSKLENVSHWKTIPNYETVPSLDAVPNWESFPIWETLPHWEIPKFETVPKNNCSQLIAGKLCAFGKL